MGISESDPCGGKTISIKDQHFEAAIERIEAASDIDELWLTVKQFCENYCFNQITYHIMNIPSLGISNIIGFSTVSVAFQRYYVSQRYYESDPVILAGSTRSVPFDWAEIDDGAPITRRIWQEWREVGIGRNAISAPIRGATGDSALLSVSSNIGDHDWALRKRRYRRDVQMIGLHLHVRFLALGGGAPTRPLPRLSPRERVCLKWAAAGKTIEDTATILSISERVVRGYLDSARRKLDCLTKTQAVVRAIQLGIISL